jgi:membrane-associated phospholipid phosphatase
MALLFGRAGMRNDTEDLFRKTGVSAAAALILYLVLFFFLDRPIDLWVHTNFANTWVFNAGRCISYLAQGSFVRLAAALCFILIFVTDHRLKNPWTRRLLCICVTAAIAMVIADGLKYLLGRYRPIMLFDHNLYGLHFFSTEWALNSTPSGHTIRAFSILTALSLLNRRFTVAFMTLAVLIGLSRIAVTAHYPIDVLFGAFIGIFTALWTWKQFEFEGDAEEQQKQLIR